MAATPDLIERDMALVRRFQSGDERAFDELVERHRRGIYRLAYRLLGNHADADDLVQEAFFRAYQFLSRFRGESSFRTWLTRIVLNLATDRKKDPAIRCHVPLGELPIHALPAALVAQGGGRVGEETLRREVGQLPPRQRETLILRIFQEMKFQEIATVMGCTVGTAKANFFHALRRLRQRVRA